MAALKSELPVTAAVAWQGSVASGMPSSSLSSSNCAEALLFESIVVTQAPVPVQEPLHPVNTRCRPACACRITCEPAAKLLLQAAPQKIPSGVLVTTQPVVEPPMFVTVKENVAVQEVAPVGVLVVPLQVRHSVAPVVGL